MIEEGYELYKAAKSLIRRANACCEKDHSDEPQFKAWESAIEFFDKSGKGYKERYEKEMEDERSKQTG